MSAVAETLGAAQRSPAEGRSHSGTRIRGVDILFWGDVEQIERPMNGDAQNTSTMSGRIGANDVTTLGSPSPAMPTVAAPVVRGVQVTPERFKALQTWEGYVLDVGESSFRGRLVDRTSRGPDEEAEFPFEEISVSDRSLIREGAVFYWVVGYRDDRSGQRSRTSAIRFRRLPVWTDSDIEKVNEQVRELKASLGAE